MQKRTLGIGVCLQLVWLLGVASLAWAQNPLRTAWGKFDGFMSDFDPLGKAIRVPLQEAFPGLRVVGFYRQWIDWNVESDTRFLSAPGPTGRRSLLFEKDHRYQQLTSMTEVQLRYTINPTLWAVGTLRHEYNGAFDTHDFSDRPHHGFGRRPRNKDIHWLTDLDYIFREAYLDWFPNPSWRIVVGRQQEAWGKLISPITDIIHGFDQRELVQLEGEDFFLRRINRFMVNLTYYTEALGGTNEFKLLWIPEWQGDRNGPLTWGANSPWNPPTFNPAAFFGLNKRLSKRPGWNFGDHEVFGRWTWSGENLTFFLMYGYLWDRTPSVWVNRNARGPTGALRPFMAHARGHGYGGGFDYGVVFNNVPFGIETLPMTITLESFFQSDLEYSPIDARAARLGGRVARNVLADNHVRRTGTRNALQFDFAFPDRWNLSSVNIFNYTFDWRKGISGGFTGPNEWLFIPVLVLAHPWRATEDRLNTTVQVFTQFSGPRQTDLWGGLKLRPIIAYSLSQYIELRLIGTLFSATASVRSGREKSWARMTPGLGIRTWGSS
jgi:hypothetical protein